MSQLDGSAVASLRRLNATKVLNVLRDEPHRQFTVHEMSVATGLSRPTVGRLLEDFSSAGWALTAQGQPGATGRPARRFSFDRDRGLIVSIDLGLRACVVLISDLVGTELAFKDVGGLDLRDPEAVMAQALASVRAALDTLDDAPDVLGVCLAAPAAFSESGVVLHSSAAPAWVGADFAAPLRTAFPDRPVLVNNDLFIMAEAEMRLGSLKNARQGMYIHAGSSTTVALTLHGKVHRGFRQLAGEIGSLADDRWQGQIDAATDMAFSDQPQSTSVLVNHAAQGKPDAVAALTGLANKVCPSIVDMAAVWDPDTIVLCGSLSHSDHFFKPIERALKEFSGAGVELCHEQVDCRRASAYGGVSRVLESIDWSA